MRKLLLILVALPYIALGQTTEPQSREELRLVETIFYETNKHIASDEDKAKLKDLVVEMCGDSTIQIKITGHCDKWGSKALNDRLSHRRAKYIVDWMLGCRVPCEQITFAGMGIDFSASSDAAARRVDISRFVEIPEPIAEPVVEPVAEPIVEPIVETTEPIAEPQPAPAETPSKCKNFTLRTNLLYLAGGMINLGTEYKSPDSDFGFLVNGGYSPFGDTDWYHNFGGWFVAPEVRYYLPCNDQWFIGAQLLACGYNVKFSETGYQGTVIGGGVMGGYKITLNDTFDMDFTLGVGYGHFTYDTYYHIESASINIRTTRRATKSSIMPIQAGVNLIWKISKR